MPDTPILVLESVSERAASLAERLRALGGYRPIVAKSADAARTLVEDPRVAARAALLSPDFPVTDLRAALEALRQQAAGRRMRFVATGPRPAPDVLVRLREAGVELALWEPFDDARLRFQLNRALAAPAQESLRREQRAPTDWRARVRGGGREKEALVYSLSAGGAFLETPRPSMRGARVSVELPFPAGSLSLDGHVLYTNVPGNLRRPELPVGMAVEFEEPAPEAERELRHAVAQALLQLVV